MGQNASERDVRQGVLASPAREFAGYRLVIDCGGSGCSRERAIDVENLASFYGPDVRIGAIVQRLRCALCGGPARSCFIETGPLLAARGRMRRVALLGPVSQHGGR